MTIQALENLVKIDKLKSFGMLIMELLEEIGLEMKEQLLQLKEQ